METVYNHLGHSRMLTDMLEQEDLTRAFMALLHHLCDTCNAKGVGLDAVSFGAPAMHGNTLKATVHFGRGGNARGSAISGNITKYFVQKHARCADALKKNPRIEEFWAGVLTTVRNYATYKHGNFKFLKVDKAIITPDNVVNITLRS